MWAYILTKNTTGLDYGEDAGTRGKILAIWVCYWKTLGKWLYGKCSSRELTWMMLTTRMSYLTPPGDEKFGLKIFREGFGNDGSVCRKCSN